MTTWKESINQYKKEVNEAREIKELHSWLNDEVEFEIFAKNYVVNINKKASQSMTTASLQPETKGKVT